MRDATGDYDAIAGPSSAVGQRAVAVWSRSVPRQEPLIEEPLIAHGDVGLGRRVAKRTFDLLFSATVLVVGLPVFLLVGLAVAVTSRGPILFAHRRIGRDGREFRVLKYRTMVHDAEEQLLALLATDADAARDFAEHHKLKNDPRITPIGNFLRRSSLDELPQFLNVLAGHMSVVGPRPIVEEELDRYGRHARAYLSVRPGVTGPWQVNGRNDTTYDERVAMDAEYASHLSLRRDLRIVARTVKVMIRRMGAY